MKSIKFNDCSKLWFIADTHFDHKNIIYYCSRPFQDTEDMHKKMMSNWNEVVKEDDIIFILGDFSFGQGSTWAWRLDALKGQKVFIKGNHDIDNHIPYHKFLIYTDGFLDILVKDPEIKGGQNVTLCHYPMLSWYHSHMGSWQLFGHVHEKPIKHAPTQMNVGVDVNNFYPVSWEQVKITITKQCLK